MTKLTIASVLRTPDNIHPHKNKHYGPSDVIKLKKGFQNFLSIDHEFVCLSDQAIPGINTIPLIGETPTWWAKLELFRPGLFSGPVFYCDLDMVICNTLDELITPCLDKNFLMLGKSPDQYAGSGLLFWNGDYSYLWNKYCENPGQYRKKYSKKPWYGDQAFIQDNVKFQYIKDIPEIDPTWLFNLNFGWTPPPESKILICCGQKNKLDKPGYDDHPWIQKFWKNI
jgi:hypothetical protein